MKLALNIKPKVGLWKLLPLTNGTCIALYPNIYIPKSVYENLTSQNSKPQYVAMIIHEQEHIKRQKDFGVLKWFLNYAFSPRFRFEEELAAIKPEMQYLKTKSIEFDIVKRSKDLSGFLYLWMVNYKKAVQELQKIDQ